jgi:predicted nucleic acid-binding protein
LARKYLLDTNIITAIKDKNRTVESHIRSMRADDEAVTSVIVIGEWEYGVLKEPSQKRRNLLREAGEALFSSLRVVPITVEVARRYAEIEVKLRRPKGAGAIPVNDAWIAATALQEDAIMVSSDPHFRKLEGLTVVDWTQPLM